MKILAIETSCDETAIAILDGTGDQHGAEFRLSGNALYSQAHTHKEYGGVFPAVAKREHARKLTPLLEIALRMAKMLEDGETVIPDGFDELLSREYELSQELRAFLSRTARPEIDAIAVTHGPGLEPALWVGVNFAQALARVWNVPIVPVNHMEGHFLAALTEETGAQEFSLTNVSLPILGLLISGGHTELVLMEDWLQYSVVGETRDDAVGEAFDKVARMLELPYPGGPEISKLSELARLDATPPQFSLPRPMLASQDYDFSFSGLKTAVLYLLRDNTFDETQKQKLAEEFENAVTEVLVAKTARALEETGAQMLILGGGVSANTHIQRAFTALCDEEHPNVTLRIPNRGLTGDNAVMIGIAGYFRALRGEFGDNLSAHGTLALS